MPTIILKTEIKAELNVVFDLSRSIDLHKVSTQQTHEEVISGKKSGLLEMGERVTWRAKHFGIWQTLTSQITEFEKPIFFVDEMIEGAFRNFRHEHHFEIFKTGTLMVDVFAYQSPLGILGKIADGLFLKKYMTEFLHKRNATIKNMAESGDAQRFFTEKKR